MDKLEQAREALKPCPFCGSANVAQGASRGRISVWCGDCFAQGPDVDFPEICIEPAAPIRKCHDLWNRRAALSRPVEGVKAEGIVDALFRDLRDRRFLKWLFAPALASPETEARPYAYTWKGRNEDEQHRKFNRNHPGFPADSPYVVEPLFASPETEARLRERVESVEQWQKWATEWAGPDEARLAQAEQHPIDRFGMIDEASGHEPLYWGRTNDIAAWGISGCEYVDQFEADLAGAMIEAAEVASHNRHAEAALSERQAHGAVKALKQAEQFIVNGVELGFIRMPYAPDPAHDTLPIIRAAISDLEPSPLCDCERGHNGMGVSGRECDCKPTTPVEQEPVEGWRYEICYGQEGETDYALVYDAQGAFVSNLRLHHAQAVVAAVNALSERQP